uniref:NADH dehydrogenase subunit 6 n=1 Tax=Knipowitschia caucasica TaxID=637954 RepID=A0AAV2LU18_KNICA
MGGWGWECWRRKGGKRLFVWFLGWWFFVLVVWVICIVCLLLFGLCMFVCVDCLVFCCFFLGCGVLLCGFVWGGGYGWWVVIGFVVGVGNLLCGVVMDVGGGGGGGVLVGGGVLGGFEGGK